MYTMGLHITGEAPNHMQPPPYDAACSRDPPNASQASIPQEEVGVHSTGVPTDPQTALEPDGGNQSNASGRPRHEPHTTWQGPDAYRPPQLQMWWRGPLHPHPQPNQEAGGAPAQTSACLQSTWCWQTSVSSSTSRRTSSHLPSNPQDNPAHRYGGSTLSHSEPAQSTHLFVDSGLWNAAVWSLT